MSSDFKCPSYATGTRSPDPPFSSFGPSRDYGMDLCLEVYLWTIYPYFTTFRVTTLSFQESPSNIVRGKNLVTVSSYRSATSHKNVLSSRDWLWLLRRQVNSWRVHAKALTLQQFTDRLNNHSWSLGILELVISPI